MSPEEMSVMWAALNIVEVRCITGQEEVSPAELDRSAMMLATPDVIDDAHDWLFGWWSATAIRKTGWGRVTNDFWSAELTPASDEKRILCSASSEAEALYPGAIRFRAGTDAAFEALLDTLAELFSKSRRAVELSPLAESLSKQMGSCLAENGYRLGGDDNRDGTPKLRVDIPLDATEEEKTRAILASATCDDRIGVTQQLADLMAGYQDKQITEHEAELVAIRVEVDRRLALAHQLLREVGLE
jgi:hypothetical protein